ncbi:MAG: RsiV family protein [Spirochaetaceae bacterium]|nr:RsiV family protein [Spirochaetaceae bacterium]
MGFHWDPYEIAPYVMGFIEIVIPYDEIAPLLR